MATKAVECKMCRARYKVPEKIQAKKVTCKKCGNAIFLSGLQSQGRRTTVGIAMTGIPTRRRGGSVATVILGSAALAAVAGALYWLS